MHLDTRHTGGSIRRPQSHTTTLCSSFPSSSCSSTLLLVLLLALLLSLLRACGRSHFHSHFFLSLHAPPCAALTHSLIINLPTLFNTTLGAQGFSLAGQLCKAVRSMRRPFLRPEVAGGRASSTGLLFHLFRIAGPLQAFFAKNSTCLDTASKHAEGGKERCWSATCVGRDMPECDRLYEQSHCNVLSYHPECRPLP